MANSTNKQNILFIVEGSRTEPRLINRMQQVFGINTDYDVYSYSTAIYELYDTLKADEYLDIVLLLKELTQDSNEKELLSRKFTKIYLLFDFDPHHQKFDMGKLLNMLHLFHDSTNGGKLYLNYPMIESFKHVGQMPDLKFITRTVSQLDVLDYKKMVGTFTNYLNDAKWTYTVARDLVIHHLSKLGYILHHQKSINELDTYDIDSSCSIALLEKQYNAYLNNALPVINTSILYLIDLKQNKFLKSLVKHQIKF